MIKKHDPCSFCSCKDCRKSIKVRDVFNFSSMFMCKSRPKKHNEILAKFCSDFECDKPGSQNSLCEECRGNKRS